MTKISKTTQAMKDDELYPVVQITYLDKTVDAIVGNHYGIHSSPAKDSPAILITINGDEANRIIIPLSIKNRTKDLKENEIEIGNFEIGSILKFDKEGNINITSKKDITLDITGDAVVNASSATINCDTEINGNKTINGNLTIVGNITASGTVSGGAVVAGGIDLETHIHPISVSSTPYTGNTGTPS